MSALTRSRPVDLRALVFTPAGLGGPMPPEAAEGFLTRECDLLSLPAAVPATVREQFAKVLRLYSDGLFAYANFTSASREAHRVLEVALKVRFLEHYADGVPLITAATARVVRIRSVEDLRRYLKRGTTLKDHPRFNASLASLLFWARAEGYFYGQRNRVREWATRKIRNYEVHTEFDSVYMPPDTVRTLRLVSEMIARLWGADMPSRTIYPGTVERELMVVGQGPLEMEGTQFLLEQLPFLDDDQARERKWYVVSSVWEEELVMWWTPEIETTSTPVTLRWGPGSWDELRDAAASLSSSCRSDTVSVVDRTFYLRTVDSAVDHARSAAQVLALRDRRENERWFVVLADAPSDARAHVHRMLTGACKPHGCSCAAALIFERAHRDTVVKHAAKTRSSKI